MLGYISYLKDFKQEKTDSIIQKLKNYYNTADPSQVSSWKTLIEDIKQSKKLSLINDNCIISIEYSLPLNGMALDIMFCGNNIEGVKQCFIIESKQWNDNYINNAKFSKYREQGYELHPQIQVSRHKNCFSNYLDIGKDYVVVPLVFIRNCTQRGIINLVSKNPDIQSQKIEIFNNIDYILGLISNSLISNSIKIEELENATFEPSKNIIDSMSSIVTREEPFILTSEQESVLKQIEEAFKQGKKIIRIIGAAGSGKTAILLNYYVELLNRRSSGEDIRPIFISGAQNTAFYRSQYPEVEQSFSYSYSLDRMVAKTKGNLYYLLMDEAQHNQEGIITRMIERNANIVLCYDVSQVINANNSIKELNEIEKRQDFISIELKDSIRFNGSQVAEKNIRNYLKGNHSIEKDSKFDFEIFDNFDDFQSKIFETIKTQPDLSFAVTGLLSDDAANFTIEGNSNSKLFTKWGNKTECEWLPYIREKNYLNKYNGNLWVGTWWMPGLDVDYVAIIVGADACLTKEGIKAVPEHAKHYRMMVSIAQALNFPEDLITEKKIFGKVSVDYVRSSQNIINYINKDAKQKEIFVNLFSKLLRNNYYIMMTRGRKGCFIYFTNRKGD